MQRPSTRALILGRATLISIVAGILGLVAFVVVKLVGFVRGLADADRPAATVAVVDSAGDATYPPKVVPVLPVPDSLLGRSRRVRFRTLIPVQAVAVPGFVRQFGETAIRTPSVRLVAPFTGAQPFAYVVLRPFGQKRGEYLGSYHLGRWPAERWLMAKNYLNPDGFVEVTPQNLNLPLSPHFKLGDFVTHDQPTVWPKYVIVKEALIDKLELVLAILEAEGVPTKYVRVLSGFRAPEYNDRGVGEGMAQASRHQYGDAADIIIDSDRDGRMDDLNKDGKVDFADTDVILRAVDRIEQKYPELRGGLGLYHAEGPSGPFAHIDVRGTTARWGSGWWKKPARGAVTAAPPAAPDSAGTVPPR